MVNKIFKGLIRFLIEVIVMTVLIVGINIFTNGMYLWGLPRINDIQSVNITYPSVTDDVKEISSSSKVWQAGGENKYEINISSATLDRPIEETASTLLHEMVHEHCMETGIKDTSNNGVYHNRRFKEQAEAHGLTVDHHEKYGWTITSPSEELLDFIIFQGWQDIQRGERLAWSDMAGTGAGSKAPGSSQTGAPKPPKAKSSTRRWVCPKCGTIIRSTKEVRVICADCMELFVKAD